MSIEDRSRKPVNKSFIARWGGVCAACHLVIQVGERARFDPYGLLVHHRHIHATAPVVVCERCWLAKPCECDSDD